MDKEKWGSIALFLNSEMLVLRQKYALICVISNKSIYDYETEVMKGMEGEVAVKVGPNNFHSRVAPLPTDYLTLQSNNPITVGVPIHLLFGNTFTVQRFKFYTKNASESPR